jgi:predicted amidohydrolase YtcJ
VLLRNAHLGTDLVDVVIDGATIAAIVPAGTATAEADSVDLDGRWLSPGLWDNHVHFTQWTLGSRRPDLSGAASARDAAAFVAQALAQDPTSPSPFVAVGFRDGLWPDVPTLEELDAAGGGHPVVLVSADLHAVWMNSAALALYDVGDHPTGFLREGPAFEITRLIDAVPAEYLDAWARDAAAAAARRGVVGIVDLEMTWNLDVWQRRIRYGVDALRVEFGIYTEHLERAIAEGLRTGDRLNDLLTVGGFKILTDGSLNTRTAYCYDPYPETEMHGSNRGLLTVPPEELVSLMRRAASSGISPIVHAIGDRANALALDAFEQIGAGGRIEHAQLLSDDDLARFAALGVQASMQPEHANDDRDVADHHWAGRTGRAFPLRSLLDAGATIVLGSDAPVAPLDPWITIAAAVTRTRGDRAPWHPEQSITVDEAIAASARTTVAVGQPADLVITDLNPLTSTAEQLRAMPVSGTVLGGRWTHLTIDSAG